MNLEEGYKLKKSCLYCMMIFDDIKLIEEMPDVTRADIKKKE